MKRIPLFLIIAFVLSSFIGCNNDKQRQDFIINLNDSTEALIQTDSFARFRDTLIGKFDGKQIDTLICEPIGPRSPKEDGIWGNWYFKWRVYTTKGTVKELVLNRYTTDIKFIKESDLDGNGTEEWSFITFWPMSNWMLYRCFTYYEGEWRLITKPTPTWRGHFETLNDGDPELIPASEIAQPSKNKGYVNIKFSDVRNDGDFLVIDTVIKVSFLPV